eukprot:TRINITY_DN4820_c0_g2_i1.p1 TRINITY_DN4820_c0_g2~~TRINITY_DN4820_c0_g2_i1.p1  ORF type:complete len:361 (-),score=65.45 TRINITY_DN4820_c0_g2_i1:161-1243(-)
MALWAFGILYAAYAVFITRWLHRVLNGKLDYIVNEDRVLAEKNFPFRRTDIKKWNHTEMYLCAIFLFPFRAILMISSIIICYLASKALTYGQDIRKLSQTRLLILRHFNQICPRLVLFGAGFWWIPRIPVNIWDVDPTYPRTYATRKDRAPLVVSNHVSWADILCILTTDECPSFISKKSIAKIPVVETVAKAMQCLFVDRDNSDERNALLDELNQRISDIRTNPLAKPLILFPEGTTTNGQALISFKKGAFAPLVPVSIYCLKYESMISPSLDSIGDLYAVILPLLQFSNKLTLFQLGTYYPDHLKLKGEDDWERYAQAIKNIMLKTLQIQDSSLGYREKSVYYKTLRATMKSDKNKTN